MKGRLIGSLLAAVLVFGIASLPVSAEVSRSFVAQLSGAQAIPPVTTKASGEATFQLSADGTALSYKLTVNDIDNVTMAHIHMAPAGQAGPIVVWLYPSSPPPKLISGTFSGVLAEGTITASDLTGPLQGHPLSDLVTAMENGNTYVNVHTEQHPTGEITGRIEVAK